MNQKIKTTPVPYVDEMRSAQQRRGVRRVTSRWNVFRGRQRSRSPHNIIVLTLIYAAFMALTAITALAQNEESKKNYPPLLEKTVPAQEQERKQEIRLLHNRLQSLHFDAKNAFLND